MPPLKYPSEQNSENHFEDPACFETREALELCETIKQLSLSPSSLSALIGNFQKDLRKIARRQRFTLNASETLSTTALINETYLKLQQSALSKYENSQHFFAVVTRAMRYVITDYARTQLAQKRGSQTDIVSLESSSTHSEQYFEDPAWQVELNDALSQLGVLHPRIAQVVQLRYYGGLRDQEIGALLAIDESTVRRDWLKARGWLFQQLREEPL